MPVSLAQSLRDWQNFYFMIGTASATLTGLLFLSVSLGTHLVAAREEGVRTFVTPTLVHFITVILLAAVMLIPVHTALSLSALLIAIGVAGCAYTLQVTLRMIRRPDQEAVDPGHWLWHAILPLVSYGAALAVAALLLAGSLDGLVWLSGSEIVLTIVGIHNAWDLVLWLARNR